MPASLNASTLEARMDSLVDERLFRAYWDAAAHFNTTDLVVCFDESVEVDPIAVYVREKLVTADDIPEALKEKIEKPAREVVGLLASAEAAFWFVAFFADGEAGYVAIRAKFVGQAGNA